MLLLAVSAPVISVTPALYWAWCGQLIELHTGCGRRQPIYTQRRRQ